MPSGQQNRRPAQGGRGRPPADDSRAVVAQGQQRAVATIDDRRAELRTELQQQLGIMAATGVGGMDPKKMAGLALTFFTRTPALWECTPVSIARAIVEANQYGLDLLFGSVYLVPYRNRQSGQKEAQLIVGYRGLATLARRSGEVSRIRARVVYQRDTFSFAYGLSEHLDHVPYQPRQGDDLDPGPMTHVYAIAEFTDGGTQFDVMTAAEVYAIRARSKGAFDGSGNLTGPWLTDEGEMSKKTVLRRLSKSLPLTVEARQALDSEDRIERDAAPVTVTAAQAAGHALAARVRDRLGAGDDLPHDTTQAPAGDDQQAGAGTASPADQPDQPAVVTGQGDAQADGGQQGDGAQQPDAPTAAAPVAKPTAPAAPAGPICGAPSPYAEGDVCTADPHARGTQHGDGRGNAWL